MRITETGKSYITFWVFIGAIVAAAAGVFWYFNFSSSEKDPSGKPYLRIVPPDSKLKSRLSDIQYHVIRENGTETAFQNKFWDFFQPGVYVDIVTGEPLFSSADKFDSKTGRPSFTKPIAAGVIVEKPDTSFDMQRTEIRTVRSNEHLGHVFNDGPPPTGKRYAVNSAALRFVPQAKMKGEGYAEFLPLVSANPTP